MTATASSTTITSWRLAAERASKRRWNSTSFAGVVSRAPGSTPRPRTKPKIVPSPSATNGLPVSAAMATRTTIAEVMM
jgi:hypothetical protein